MSAACRGAASPLLAGPGTFALTRKKEKRTKPRLFACTFGSGAAPAFALLRTSVQLRQRYRLGRSTLRKLKRTVGFNLQVRSHGMTFPAPLSFRGRRQFASIVDEGDHLLPGW